MQGFFSYLPLSFGFAENPPAGRGFCQPSTPSPLLALVRTAAATDPAAALAMVAAYEIQASDIAASKR